MPLKLEKADSQTITAFKSLMQLFLHEMSGFRPDEVNSDGLFDHPYLIDLPGEETDLLLVKVKGHLAGFAVVTHLESETRLLSSIFLLNAYRGLGIGREAAHMVFDHYPGKWIVLAMETSTPAKTFWRRVIRAYTYRHYSAEPDPSRGSLAFHFTTSEERIASDSSHTAFQA
jgi:predicted acetyltransferase